MKTNMKKTVGASVLALALTFSGGTIAFAANTQTAGRQNPNASAENGTAAAYMTAADYKNNTNLEEDMLLPEDGTATAYVTAADYKNNTSLEEDVSAAKAKASDSGVKYMPEGEGFVRDDAGLGQVRK